MIDWEDPKFSNIVYGYIAACGRITYVAILYHFTCTYCTVYRVVSQVVKQDNVRGHQNYQHITMKPCK